MAPKTRVILLGPQRHDPNVDVAVAALGVPARARVAAITAGWEERELEDQELVAHLGGRAVNLNVWQRVEAVYERDPELQRAVRARHDKLRRLQDLYRLRLLHALAAARDLQVAQVDPELREGELADAIESVRALDRQHLARVREIHAEFVAMHRPSDRAHVARQRREIEKVLADVAGVCIAGGHVGILVSRMRLFGLGELLAGHAIVAWSAGAMALSERVVLFHDSPPQGQGDAEVFGPALGICPGIVPLPHASARLRLDDPLRVALFASRFAPDLCVALDKGSRVDWDGKRWHAAECTCRLHPRGDLAAVGDS